MIGEQAALIAAHAEVIDEKLTSRCRLLGGIEGTTERLKDCVDLAVQLANFSNHRPHELRLVGREIGKVLRSFAMLDLRLLGKVSIACHITTTHKLVPKLAVHVSGLVSSLGEMAVMQ